MEPKSQLSTGRPAQEPHVALQLHSSAARACLKNSRDGVSNLQFLCRVAEKGKWKGCFQLRKSQGGG